MHFCNLWAFVEWPASISKLAHAGPCVRTNFSGGPNISEKFVPGVTNARGLQIKRDSDQRGQQ